MVVCAECGPCFWPRTAQGHYDGCEDQCRNECMPVCLWFECDCMWIVPCWIPRDVCPMPMSNVPTMSLLCRVTCASCFSAAHIVLRCLTMSSRVESSPVSVRMGNIIVYCHSSRRETAFSLCYGPMLRTYPIPVGVPTVPQYLVRLYRRYRHLACGTSVFST